MTLLQHPLSDSSERIILGLPPAFHLPVTVRGGFRAVAQNGIRAVYKPFYQEIEALAKTEKKTYF
jgi:hypothetical protein